VEVLYFVAGAVLGFVCLATIGRPHLADEIPMRVPWLVVFNLFPIVAAVAVIALPTHLFGKGPGYFMNSLLATAVYVLCLAILIRVRDRRLLS
jgi:cytochrome bd-type quinol oxidase subunit 2